MAMIQQAQESSVSCHSGGEVLAVVLEQCPLIKKRLP